MARRLRITSCRRGNVRPEASRNTGGLGLALAATIAILRRTVGPERTSSVIAATSMATISVVVALVASEFAVRWIYRDITTTSDNTSYFARRWESTAAPRKNNLGFRDRNVSTTPRTGDYRIVLIGDSFAWGQGIGEEDRFGNLVESALDAGGFPVDVVNVSRPGAETLDHIEFLSEPALQLEPDFILLQWFVNDFENGDYGGRPQYRRLIPSDTISNFLHANSALYYLANLLWMNAQDWLAGERRRSYMDYMAARFAAPDGAEMERGVGTLRQFVDIARASGTPVGFVLFPFLSDDLPDYQLAFLHERVMALCEEEELACLDLRHVYAEHQPVSSLRLNLFDNHPGREANAIAAAAIIEKFGPRWRRDATRHNGLAADGPPGKSETTRLAGAPP